MSQVGQSFGPNMPPRILGSAQLVLEPGEVAPTLPWYQPLVPFYPAIIDGSGSSLSSSALNLVNGVQVWERVPSRCDLLFYQGDDIVIPLYFNDPSVLGDDMAEDFEWVAQIRRVHSYSSMLINEFVTKAVYVPRSPTPPETEEYTVVELFLPRSKNLYAGVYRWELYSTSPEDYSRFPKPDDVDAADWPPPDALRTWLYGYCTIVPRLTTTDTLPASAFALSGPGVVVVTNQGWVVGPNGRVP